MSEISRTLEMNGSTCFNLLKTLADERLLSYNPQTKTYQLGLRLVELASLVDGHRQAVSIAMKWISGLVSDVELTCLLVRPAAQDEFLVVDKLESPKAIKVTVEVGTLFPPNAPVLAKCYYAFQDDVRVDDMIARHGLPPYRPTAITNTDQFKEALKEVREHGYAVSVAEYWQDHNALSAPIFDSEGRVNYLLVLVGFGWELSEETIGSCGEALRGTADAITREIGGRQPVIRSAARSVSE